MKERPIIFNGEMVRAILEGRKTQTRRPVKFPFFDKNMGCELAGNELAGEVRAGNYSNVPFGRIGDRLWVRETWQGPLVDYDDAYSMFKDPTPYQKVENCVYRADGGPCPEFTDADDELRQGWRPSIHMPRWACRILLEITDVRVERLQDISEADAIAEGGTKHFNIDWFGPLWASIYGVESWNTNPWVWVIEFKRAGVQP